jgi:hypothetical protein
MLMPALETARMRAKEVSGLSNEKQLPIIWQMYGLEEPHGIMPMHTWESTPANPSPYPYTSFKDQYEPGAFNQLCSNNYNPGAIEWGSHYYEVPQIQAAQASWYDYPCPHGPYNVLPSSMGGTDCRDWVSGTVSEFVDSPEAFIVPLDDGSNGWDWSPYALHDQGIAFGGGACSEELQSNPCWYGGTGIDDLHCEGASMQYSPATHDMNGQIAHQNNVQYLINDDLGGFEFTQDQWMTNSVPCEEPGYACDNRMTGPDGSGPDGLLFGNHSSSIENGRNADRAWETGFWTMTACRVNGEARVFKWNMYDWGIPEGWFGSVHNQMFRYRGWKEMLEGEQAGFTW